VLGHLLLWTISGVYKDLKIQTTTNAVCAINNNFMLVCINKTVVKYKVPCAMEKLTMAMHKENLERSLAMVLFLDKIGNLVRKLLSCKNMEYKAMI
jgi:hypothetical protein